MLFVNPTALDWADAKGESLGTKGGFSWAARNSQTLAEMLGVRAPLLSALSCGACRPSQGRPCLGGALPVVPISGFSGTLEPAGPWSPHASRASAHRVRDEERGNAVRARSFGSVCCHLPGPGALLLPLGKAPTAATPGQSSLPAAAPGQSSLPAAATPAPPGAGGLAMCLWSGSSS